jgi:hypothetical protein
VVIADCLPVSSELVCSIFCIIDGILSVLQANFDFPTRK